MRSIYILLFLLLISIAAHAQEQRLLVEPRAVDSSIVDWTEPHVVMLDRSRPLRGKLLLFMPGSYGRPTNTELILTLAASEGYHVIGLRYPNSWTVAGICDSSTDASCFERVRREIIDGIDRSDAIAVDSTNSIEGRLAALLRYLAENHPNGSWGQYLDHDGTLRWPAIVVAGHSQGAGQAGLIAKLHRVDRAILFAGKDYNIALDQAAPWQSEPGATGADRYYGFTHLADGMLRQAIVWRELGLLPYGQIENVDTASPPYGGTHMLTTAAEPAQPGEYHGSVVVDRNVPVNSKGVPLYLDAWRYLIGASSILHVDREERASLSVSAAPNPFSDATTIRVEIDRPGALTVTLFDLLGRTLFSHDENTVEPGTRFVPIDGSRLAAGTYYYRVETSSGAQAGVMQVVR